MDEENFKRVIRIVYESINKNNIKWALIGSVNLKLQGMEIEPSDLDIVVMLEDLEKIRRIFSEYNPSKIKKLNPLGGNSAFEVKVIIEGIEVQILGEERGGVYIVNLLKNKLTKIKLEDMEIPSFTLGAEAEAYRETKREQKAALIKEFLKKNPVSD
jgi:hypothetical protein